jgi:hypothetical protein
MNEETNSYNYRNSIPEYDNEQGCFNIVFGIVIVAIILIAFAIIGILKT